MEFEKPIYLPKASKHNKRNEADVNPTKRARMARLRCVFSGGATMYYSGSNEYVLQTPQKRNGNLNSADEVRVCLIMLKISVEFIFTEQIHKNPGY